MSRPPVGYEYGEGDKKKKKEKKTKNKNEEIQYGDFAYIYLFSSHPPLVRHSHPIPRLRDARTFLAMMSKDCFSFFFFFFFFLPTNFDRLQ